MQRFNAARDTVLGPHEANGVPGFAVTVITDLGNQVRAWRAAPVVASNDYRYFCHGYSFGTSYIRFGQDGGYSLFGDSVPQVLADEYKLLGAADSVQDVQVGDLLVWWSKQPYHSAIVETPILVAGQGLNLATTLVNSKTGTSALRLRVPLGKVETEDYPGRFRIEVYRRLG
jgi:hypothetical protein